MYKDIMNCNFSLYLFVVAVIQILSLRKEDICALMKGNHLYDMSLVMRKPDFCICENKDADQLRGNREADLRLCFRYTDSTMPLLPKSKISSL